MNTVRAMITPAPPPQAGAELDNPRAAVGQDGEGGCGMVRSAGYLVARRAAAWGLMLAFGLAASAEAADRALDALADTAAALCRAADRDHTAMAGMIGARAGAERVRGRGGQPVRIRRHFETEAGGALHLVLDRFGGVLRGVTLERYLVGDDGERRPEAVVLLGGDCAPSHARRIVYDDTGLALEIVQYGSDLSEQGPAEPLNPPLPVRRESAMADGVIVAHIDSGLAYTLPRFADRLVYGPDGRPLGYDYWDMNDRPFDAETSRSIFFPLRHGTRVASVLLREAPEARIIPYRYPRPDMSRMTALIADAAAAGARIVLMPMGSSDPDDWSAFEDAAWAHPDLLFVLSAGNDNRDLDAAPAWPAALSLDNAVVVTSAEEDGRLARGVNWGSRTVDLMVPAENIEVVDHRGARQIDSGTSFAVARLGALAARRLAEAPETTPAELKAALFALAEPAEGVRHGWIGNPDAR